MIRIQHADLPEGWHVQAVAQGRRTVIYLRPGLTPQQRWDSLRRARQSARMGYGPRLPAAGVAIAVAADTVASVLRNLVAAVRWHLLGSLLLVVALAAGAVCYVLLVTVSLRFLGPPSSSLEYPHSPRLGAQFGAGRGAPPGFTGGIAVAPSAGSRGSGAPGSRSRGGRGGPSPHPRRSPGASPSGSPRPTPGPTGPSPVPTPSRTPSPRPTHSPRPSPSPSPTCILIICLPHI